MAAHRPYVAVVGAGRCEPSLAARAEEVGRLLASHGAVLVCGGRSGVMEAACRGAKGAGGLTVGLLPGNERREGNRWLDVALPTGLGEARNLLVVRAADALIAVGGEYGTLSEIAFALKTGKPVVGLDTWELGRAGRPVAAIVQATEPREAVERALELATTTPPRAD